MRRRRRRRRLPVRGVRSRDDAGALGAKPRVAKASAESGSGLVTLNFNNAEIEAIARTIVSMGGGNVVIDPRIKGTMSLSSATPVTPAQALRLFALQLRAQGYTACQPMPRRYVGMT